MGPDMNMNTPRYLLSELNQSINQLTNRSVTMQISYAASQPHLYALETNSSNDNNIICIA